MDRETRIAWLVDHAGRQRHRGALPDADVRVPGGNPGCGDVVVIYLRADAAEDRVAAVSFEGKGCTLSQAAASILADRTNRLRPTFADVLRFADAEMMELVGRDVADARPRCAALALSTLKVAVKALAMNRELRRAGHSASGIATLREAVAASAAGAGSDLAQEAEAGATS
jgi:nitrogen fixation protein NifU and related proteins